ncbi:MAG: hypothetical protein CVU57_11120 [Deltaproteobacteria bacterium HGW-Deltaproteobacteria-15]|nr:MAG: hypothetical protein CVU57_11120 [Deltaproteobacteria bacterium HGW-Deltaproteobacteria-15]
MKRLGCGIIALIGIAFFFFSAPAECQNWFKLADGLLLGEFTPSRKSPISDHPVTVLRIDPARYSFRLLSALEHGGKERTARGWCEEFGLLAAINASMYMVDLRSTGYMRNYQSTNNPAFNRAFGAFMVFNPKDPSMPPVRMVDSRREKEWRSILDQYDSVIQNYRMISGGRKVDWPEQDKPHSTAAIGMDNDGHVLFILGRAPYTPHDFINILLALPIRIKDAMYLEGGDEASLSVRQQGKWLEWTGIGELGIFSVQGAPKLPNVIGIVNR